MKECNSPLLQTAVRAFEAQDLNLAESQLCSLLAQRRDPTALLLLGYVYLQAGRPDLARQLFTELVISYGDNPAYRQARGRSLAELKDHRAAAEDFNFCLNHGLRDIDTLHLAAMNCEALLWVSQAIILYEELLTLKPDHAEARNCLGYLYLYAEKWEAGWNLHRYRASRVVTGRGPVDDHSLLRLCRQDLVYIEGEQGLGDELFFLRFLPKLRGRMGKRVVYLAQSPKLLALKPQLPYLDDIVPKEQIGAELETIPVADLPYLCLLMQCDVLPPPLRFHIEARRETVFHALALDPMKRWCFVTCAAGGTTADIQGYQALKKQVTCASVLPFLPKGHCIAALDRLASGRDYPKDWANPEAKFVHDNLVELLALLAHVDHYAGVSNTNMYLRQYLGLTATVFVPGSGDFRWGYQGESSVWFPGFTVVRMPTT